MNRRINRASLLAGASALTLSPSPLFAASGNSAPLVIGTLPSAADAVVNYADDNGYFKDIGLDTKISFMDNGNLVFNAVVGGSLDIGAGNIGSVAVARAHGVPLRAIAPASEITMTAPSVVIMVRKDSPMRRGADFNNKTVAVIAIKTPTEIVFRMWVDKTGGDAKTLKFIELPYPAMTAAVEAGRADVGLTADPFAMMARATNTILPDNFFSALALPVLITCFVATEQWLDANADRARKFATAIRRAAVWANGHQAETHPLLARITNMDPKLIPGMAPTVFGTSLEPAQIAPVVDAMLKYGLIDKRVDPKEMIWQ